MAEATKAKLPGMPECFVQRGWPTLPPEVLTFQQALIAQPVVLPEVVLPADWDSASVLDVATDGSAWCPNQPHVRIAGWAVVGIRPEATPPCKLLTSGCVPGLLQTALRGEIWAAMVAVYAACIHGIEVRVWSDNELVVNRSNAIAQGIFTSDSNTADSDLWGQMEDLIRQWHPLVTFHKVTSHLQLDVLTGADHLIAQANSWADVHADDAIRSQSHSLLASHAQAVQVMNEYLQMTIDLHDHFVRVGEQAILYKSTHAVGTSEDCVEAPEQPVEGSDIALIDFARIAGGLEVRPPPRFGSSIQSQVCQWLRSFQQSPCEEVVMSWHEIFVSFQMYTGYVGMCRPRQNGWEVVKQMDPYDFVSASKTFATYVQGLLKAAYPAWKPHFARPSNPQFRTWTSVVRVRIQCAWKMKIWRWFQQHLAGIDCRHIGKALRALPRADLDEVDVPAPQGLHRFFGR